MFVDRAVNNCFSEVSQTQKDKYHVLSLFVDASFETLDMFISFRKPRVRRLISSYGIRMVRGQEIQYSVINWESAIKDFAKGHIKPISIETC